MFYNLNELLQKLIEQTARIADRVNTSHNSMFVAGVVLALVIGLLGYRLIKPIMGIFIGLVGYFAGADLFGYLHETSSVVSNAPAWNGYIVGAVIALGFMALGFSKFSYAMFALYALISFNFIFRALPEHLLIAIAGAMVIAFLSTLVVRFSFILISSATGGFASVMYLGTLLPKVKFLQLGEQKAAFWVAFGLSAFFLIFQYATRSKKNTSLY